MGYLKYIFKLNFLQVMVYLVVFLAIILTFFILSYNSKNNSRWFSPYEVVINKLRQVQELKINNIDNALFYEDSLKKTLSIQIKFRGGAALDPMEYEGTSYLLSKLLIYSTDNLSNSELNTLLDNNSIKLISYSNRDSLTIQITGLIYYKQKIFELLNSIINNTTYTNENLDFVKRQVKSEQLYYTHTPSFLINKILRENVIKSTYYRNILGSTESLDKINLPTIIKLRKRIFTLSNVYIAVSGSSNINELQTELNKIFKKFPVNSNNDYNYADINIKTNGNYYENKSNINIPYDNTLFILPNINRYSNDYAYIYLINLLLGVKPNSLLFNKLKMENNYVYNISSYINYDIYSNIWIIKLSSTYNYLLIKDNIINLFEDIKRGIYSEKEIKDTLNWFLITLLDNNLSNNVDIANTINNIQLYGNGIANYLEFITTMYNAKKSDFTRVLNQIDLSKIDIIHISR